MYHRLEQLRKRRIDPMIKSASQLSEAYERVLGSESVKYALGCMRPIDEAYTKKSYEEADRVANQLKSGLTQNLEFDYQGSVTNDTHIKAHSDIDLLTILSPRTFFFYVEPPLTIVPPEQYYQGDPFADFRKLKNDSTNLLRTQFPQAKVEVGGKAIAISGGSLARKVDVVPSAWRDSREWRQGFNKVFRGITVYDTDSGSLIHNKPFYHNARLHQKDQESAGGLRKSIRLMKSLKFDATNEVNLSSYHICGIAYTAPSHMLTVAAGHDLQLVEQTRVWCEHLRDNPALRDSITMPNETEKVFGILGAQPAGLNQMIAELRGLERDILNDNARSFKKLAEARYEVPTSTPQYMVSG